MTKTKWMMNKKPAHGCCYEPTSAEHIASILTHALMIPLAMMGFIFLLMKAASFGTFFMATVHGVFLVVLFTVSSGFHVVFYLHSDPDVVETMRKADRAVIYLFIASSYTPWFFLNSFPEGYKLLIHARWIIWSLALLGFAFELTISRQFPVFGMVAYIIYGMIPAAILDTQMNFPGISELKFAGGIYLIGVMFFKSEGLVPFAHAIWHICVIFGASMHYMTVYKYFYTGFSDSPIPWNNEI